MFNIILFIYTIVALNIHGSDEDDYVLCQQSPSQSPHSQSPGYVFVDKNENEEDLTKMPAVTNNNNHFDINQLIKDIEADQSIKSQQQEEQIKKAAIAVVGLAGLVFIGIHYFINGK